ncbi:MAG: SUMF1/EgtB/PvdO family nonheme iron enzyme, partial [Planctomycetes bacterium]|nr:SUMF1/EgtB/PvdO family nonheme iron enzyme [Planctomycetota bacterium]
ERCLERARKLDRTGVRARLLVARGSLLIRGGADEELYLFRHVPAFTLRAGETSERWIPAPCAADGSVLTDPSLPIGRCCLLVTRDHPGLGLHSGDLIVEIEGRPLSDAYYFGRVDPDGLAGRAGVRAWDRVDRIDGIEAVSWSEIRRAVCFGDASLAVESTSFDGQHVRFNLGNREPRKTVFEQAAGVEFARLPELLESFVPGRPVRLGVRQAGSGSRLDRALPADGFAGLKTTLTIYPLCPIPACRLRSRELELVVGEYTVLSRPPGSTRWVRDYVSVGIDRETTLDLASLPDPPPLTGGDVVWVPSGTLDRPIDARAPGARPNPAVQVPGFWIDRHELTLAEWNAFTTDPTIAAETEKHYAETGFYTLVPRSKESTSRRTTSQPMSLLSAARWVDYEDVLRYVRWVNERLEREDSAWRADLPTMDQWERAAGSTRDRVFPWGDTFEPGLVHFQFTWPDNIRMPTGSVLGDESPFGVRDLAGCVAEWLREPREDLRSGSFIWVAGGCYSYTWGDAFRTQSLTAESRSGVNDITGIRLVYEPRR